MLFMLNQTYAKTFTSMGTKGDIIIPGMSENEGDEIFLILKTRLDFLESVFNIYNPGSELSRFNRTDNNNPIVVSPELFKLIIETKVHYDKTRGLFNAAIWPLSEIWKLENSKAGIENVEKNELEKAIKLSLFDFRFNEKDVSIEKKVGQGLDFGGFLKGYALDLAKEILIEYSVDDAFIHIGQSSIMAIGNHPGGEGWKISIPDPVNTKKVLKKLTLNNQSISFSGSPYYKNEKSHIINPKTGNSKELDSLTYAIGSYARVCEVLSTASLIEETIPDFIFNEYSAYDIKKIKVL